ncbi:hypothetical protein JHW40_01290 [Paracoccus alcaliphilus]|nr:hypothetical protein JHW40_01290 [Paracoccus alcaliphilus]
MNETVRTLIALACVALLITVSWSAMDDLKEAHDRKHRANIVFDERDD